MTTDLSSSDVPWYNIADASSSMQIQIQFGIQHLKNTDETKDKLFPDKRPLEKPQTRDKTNV
jgi:hypothetical protein